MASPTATQIRDILKAGTFTDPALTSNRFFATAQPKTRRRYPSVEIVDVKPQSLNETKERSQFSTTYEIRYYKRTRGGQTTGSEDEHQLVTTTQVEILDLIDLAVLEDHKIVSEDKTWNEKHQPDKIPPHILSILTVAVLRITAPPTGTPDGVLTFLIAGSNVDNPPGADYTYIQTFNTEYTEGHNKFDEYTTQTEDPKRYSGGFRGSFITHIRVFDTDLGATGDKLNQLTKLRSNGTFPEVSFQYNNKATDVPTKTIKKDLKLTIDDIQELYRTGDTTIFRILASPLEHSITTVI